MIDATANQMKTCDRRSVETHPPHIHHDIHQIRLHTRPSTLRFATRETHMTALSSSHVTCLVLIFESQPFHRILLELLKLLVRSGSKTFVLASWAGGGLVVAPPYQPAPGMSAAAAGAWSKLVFVCLSSTSNRRCHGA